MEGVQGFCVIMTQCIQKLIYDSPLIIPNIEMLFDCSASFNDGGKSIPTNTCCMIHLIIKRDKLKHLLSLN